jgi:hypothetical protein
MKRDVFIAVGRGVWGRLRLHRGLKDGHARGLKDGHARGLKDGHARGLKALHRAPKDPTDPRQDGTRPLRIPGVNEDHNEIHITPYETHNSQRRSCEIQLSP